MMEPCRYCAACESVFTIVESRAHLHYATLTNCRQKRRLGRAGTKFDLSNCWIRFSSSVGLGVDAGCRDACWMWRCADEGILYINYFKNIYVCHHWAYGEQSCAMRNKYECTMDQELVNAAAFGLGITEIEILKTSKRVFFLKINK